MYTTEFKNLVLGRKKFPPNHTYCARATISALLLLYYFYIVNVCRFGIDNT